MAETQAAQRFSVCIYSVTLSRIPEGLEEPDEVGLRAWIEGFPSDKIQPAFDPEPLEPEEGAETNDYGEPLPPVSWTFVPRICWRIGEQPKLIRLALVDQEDDEADMPAGSLELSSHEFPPASSLAGAQFREALLETRCPESGAAGPSVALRYLVWSGEEDPEELGSLEEIPIDVELGPGAAGSRLRYCVEARIRGIAGKLPVSDSLVVELTPELPLEMRTSRDTRNTAPSAPGSAQWKGRGGVVSWTVARGSRAFLQPPRRLRCELRRQAPGGKVLPAALGHCSLELPAERFDVEEAAAEPESHEIVVFLSQHAPADADDVRLVMDTVCSRVELRPEEFVGFSVKEEASIQRLVVDSVAAGSEALRLGVKPGLRLLAVNGEDLRTLEELDRARSKVWPGEFYRYRFMTAAGEELPEIEIEFQEAHQNPGIGVWDCDEEEEEKEAGPEEAQAPEEPAPGPSHEGPPESLPLVSPAAASLRKDSVPPAELLDERKRPDHVAVHVREEPQEHTPLLLGLSSREEEFLVDEEPKSWVRNPAQRTCAYLSLLLLLFAVLCYVSWETNRD